MLELERWPVESPAFQTERESVRQRSEQWEQEYASKWNSSTAAENETTEESQQQTASQDDRGKIDVAEVEQGVWKEGHEHSHRSEWRYLGPHFAQSSWLNETRCLF